MANICQDLKYDESLGRWFNSLLYGKSPTFHSCLRLLYLLGWLWVGDLYTSNSVDGRGKWTSLSRNHTGRFRSCWRFFFKRLISIRNLVHKINNVKVVLQKNPLNQYKFKDCRNVYSSNHPIPKRNIKNPASISSGVSKRHQIEKRIIAYLLGLNCICQHLKRSLRNLT